MINTLHKKIPKRYLIAATGWFSRISSAISQIIAIAILLNYLGTDQYAAFAVIIGLQLWFGLSEIGVGSSLQNHISEARAANKETRPILANTAIICWTLLIVITIAFVFLAPLLQHLLFRKIDPSLASSQYYILTTVGIICIATTIFSISYKVFFANHRGHLAYFCIGIAPVFSVTATIVIKYININQYKLLLMLLCWLVPQLLISFIAFAQTFLFKKIFKYFDFYIIKSIMHRGVFFWGITAASSLTTLTDYIIMSQTLTNKDIATYNILFKCFNSILFVYSAILSATWPELAELFAKNQWRNANNALINNIKTGWLFVTICFAILLLGKKHIMHILAPHSYITLPTITILLFGLYTIIRVWTDSFATALQSQNSLKILLILTPFQAIFGIFGMYFFSSHYGLNGILFGLILCFILTSSLVLPWVYFRKSNRT